MPAAAWPRRSSSQQSGGSSTQMVPPSVMKYSSLKRADLYQEGSWLQARGKLSRSG